MKRFAAIFAGLLLALGLGLTGSASASTTDDLGILAAANVSEVGAGGATGTANYGATCSTTSVPNVVVSTNPVGNDPVFYFADGSCTVPTAVVPATGIPTPIPPSNSAVSPP